ncbi:MAG TPA: NnrU family protein [Stellaceae bacterium]|nr:NnrU family protein [Stellaceae bacterium]
MLSLILAALFFIAIHLGIAGTALRDRAIGTLGTRGYMAAFSIASVVGIVWLVVAYRDAPYVALWGMLGWWRPFAVVLMLPAVLLFTVGLATPNPTSVAQERRLAEPARGVVRVTRHPFLMGVTLWAVVHLVGNGDAASFVFFATWIVIAGAGTVSIDAKRRRLQGATLWDPFAAQTSILPFAAIWEGRNHFRPGEIGLWRWLAGLAVYAVILATHARIIGVSPI